MVHYTSGKCFADELKKTQNSVIAYLNFHQDKKLTTSEIEEGSFKLLENNFESVFFEKKSGVASYLKNTGKVLNVVTSLGGSYKLALQEKHYSDMYETLYQPVIAELQTVEGDTNSKLNQIGELLKRTYALIIRAEKILKSSYAFSEKTMANRLATLDRIKKFDSGYSATLTAGFGGIAGGSTALGAWGLVSILGSASTGTAISSLSGVAATNATLAWFGGGSLAVGGAGMTGGFWVLGGIVAAPMIYFSTTNSYKKSTKIKQEKARLVDEIDKASNLSVEAIKQLDEITKQHRNILQLVDSIEPEFEAAFRAFRTHSSLWYRLFGGRMNTQQLAATKQLNDLSQKALDALGIL